jgi:hypothetical protein
MNRKTTYTQRRRSLQAYSKLKLKYFEKMSGECRDADLHLELNIQQVLLQLVQSCHLDPVVAPLPFWLWD